MNIVPKRRGYTVIELLVTFAILVIAGLIVAAVFGASGCQESAPSPPKATSGVNKAIATVEVGEDGLTVEQRNVKMRLERDNQPGSIKHLYVISAFSGDVLIYSTVNGKVTSSSKRLTPTQVAATDTDTSAMSGHRKFGGIPVDIGGQRYYTGEVLQDDGTYGSSVRYLYWFDSKGVYHQHYVSGGQIVHISDQPLSVPKVIINMDPEFAK